MPPNTHTLKPTLAIYRQGEIHVRRVFCGDCVYHDSFRGVYSELQHRCILKSEYKTDCVTGERIRTATAYCEQHNGSLDCAEHSPTPPPWWKRWLGLQ